MIKREAFIKRIKEQFEVHRIVAILGPRQCGKTSIAREICGPDMQRSHYFDLENRTDLERLANPQLVLGQLTGLIVIDEVQRHTDLFSILRVLHDMDNSRRFLILGSASRELIQQSSESLAGRIGYIELTPFNISETNDAKKLWLRGGFPNSFIAETEQRSFNWRTEYIRTFLEQDIPNLGLKIPAPRLMRFWLMLAHYHGQIFNAHELGQSLDLSGNTIRHYLDILSGTFMVRVLAPWYENIKKRQVKSPKIYFRDSGIFHALLDIKDLNGLLVQPKMGASWEGFALEQIIQTANTPHCYFWSVHSQAELDLLVIKEGKRFGFEFKYTDKPHITKSIRIAMSSLDLDQTIVVYPGDVSFPLEEKISALTLTEAMKLFSP